MTSNNKAENEPSQARLVTEVRPCLSTSVRASSNKCSNSKSVLDEKIREYLSSPKHLERSSPWTNSICQEWGLGIGSSHSIYSVTGKVQVPFSVIPAVILRGNVQEEYKTLLKSMHSMYSRVQREGMDAGSEVVLRKNAYAVAWIPEKSRFFRVRVKELWEGDRVLVNCFDNGIRTFVEAEQLFPICTKFLTLRPRVVNLNLDGLEHFDHCTDLKRIMEGRTKWKHATFGYKVTRHVREKGKSSTTEIFGLLFEVDKDESDFTDLNAAFIQKFWKGVPRLTLPEESFGMPDWSVTHALEDGTLFVTYNNSVAVAFRDYRSKVKRSLDGLKKVSTDPEVAEETNAVPVDPKEIYVTDFAESVSRVKVVSKIQKTRKGARAGNQPDFVRVRFIDNGKEEDCIVSSLHLAKSLHPYFALVPPMCVKVHLVNVASLNVTRFMKELAVKKPFILRTVKRQAGVTPAEVQLFMNRQVGSGMCTFVSVGEEAFTIQMAKRPQRLVPEFSPTVPDFVQLENIDMTWGTDWSECPGQDTFLPLELDLRIHFVIKNAISVSEFVIHPIGSESTIMFISDLIAKHVTKPWVEKTMRSEMNQMHPNWFYTYFRKEKNCYTRVRFIERAPLDTVKVLLVDFAEYVEVPLTELIPTIPVSACRPGPQAARVIKYVHDIPLLKEFTSLENFKQVYQGKKCSALLQEVTLDAHEMTTLKIKRLQLTATSF